MIERILPDVVASAAITTDPPGLRLHPAEAAQLTRAVAKRRQEFAAVRLCARRALAQLAVGPVPILSDERGAPCWPAGVVGSMTHCRGYRAAAVARDTEVETVGIDAEPHAPLPAGLLPEIALDGERTRLARLAARRPEVHWDRLLFSAKEAVYKAWYPLTRRRLGFAEADIELRPDGCFTARLLAPDRRTTRGDELTELDGRWLAADGVVVTAIARLRPPFAAESTVPRQHPIRSA